MEEGLEFERASNCVNHLGKRRLACLQDLRTDREFAEKQCQIYSRFFNEIFDNLNNYYYALCDYVFVNQRISVGFDYAYLNIVSVQGLRGRDLVLEEVFLKIREIQESLGLRLRITSPHYEQYLLKMDLRQSEKSISTKSGAVLERSTRLRVLEHQETDQRPFEDSSGADDRPLRGARKQTYLFESSDQRDSPMPEYRQDLRRELQIENRIVEELTQEVRNQREDLPQQQVAEGDR